MLGIQTRGQWMVGADGSTDLWHRYKLLEDVVHGLKWIKVLQQTPLVPNTVFFLLKLKGQQGRGTSYTVTVQICAFQIWHFGCWQSDIHTLFKQRIMSYYKCRWFFPICLGTILVLLYCTIRMDSPNSTGSFKCHIG